MEEEGAEANPNRLNITKKHLDILIQYMERYPRLALATARNREAHVQSRHMWEKIARTLNKIDINVNKTGREWKKYWVGRKFKARRKYSTICRCASEGGSCPPLSLDTFDQKIVNIITDDEGNLLPVTSICHNTHQYMDTGGGGGCGGGGGGGQAQEQELDVSVKREDPIRVEALSYPADRTKTTRSDIKRSSQNKNSEPKSRTEELRRRILEFELSRQRELFEMEKAQMRERHKVEMEVLELKKQLLIRDLNNS